MKILTPIFLKNRGFYVNFLSPKCYVLLFMHSYDGIYSEICTFLKRNERIRQQPAQRLVIVADVISVVTAHEHMNSMALFIGLFGRPYLLGISLTGRYNNVAVKELNQ